MRKYILNFPGKLRIIQKNCWKFHCLGVGKGQYGAFKLWLTYYRTLALLYWILSTCFIERLNLVASKSDCAILLDFAKLLMIFFKFNIKTQSILWMMFFSAFATPPQYYFRHAIVPLYPASHHTMCSCIIINNIV